MINTNFVFEIQKFDSNYSNHRLECEIKFDALIGVCRQECGAKFVPEDDEVLEKNWKPPKSR